MLPIGVTFYLILVGSFATELTLQNQTEILTTSSSTKSSNGFDSFQTTPTYIISTERISETTSNNWSNKNNIYLKTYVKTKKYSEQVQNGEKMRVWSPKHVEVVKLDSNNKIKKISKEVSVTTEPTYPASYLRKDDPTKRRRRQMDEEDTLSPQCKPFVVGDPDQQVFYSPGHPENYPNQTDCVRVISANHGQLIRLDFRDQFNIEPSDKCSFDYLEVRDGAHGYSPLIGMFCGHDFPPLLTSQSRFLWLHFHSDDNIEYGGFTAIYEFIPRPTTQFYQPEAEVCKIYVNGSEGYVNSSDVSEEALRNTIDYGMILDCMWIITVDPGKKIQLWFGTFKLAKPNDCDNNFVDVFSERTDLSSRLKNFCGSIADTVESNSNILHVRYMATPKAVNSSFSALFTAVRDKPKDKECNDDEYDCEDNTCISKVLRCNGRNNCRFKWDEDGCKEDTGGGLMQSEHIVIIMVIFSLILFGMSAAFVFNCVKKLISDHRTIQEHIRQSREGNLDDLDRMSTKIAEPVSKILLKQDTLSPKSRSSSIQLDNTDCYVPGVGEILPILLQNNMRDRLNGDASIPQNNRDNEFKQKSLQKQTRQLHEEDDEEALDIMGSGNVPEMCDMSCQTRESLFQTPILFGHQLSSERSFSPPPPSIDYSRKPHRDVHSSSHSSSIRQGYPECTTPFSTFGYSGGSMNRSDTRSQSGKSSRDPHYKAEAVIEMDRFRDEGNGNYGDPNRNMEGKSLSQRFIDDQKNRNRLDSDNHSKTLHSKGTDKLFYEQKKRPYSVETTKSAPDVIIMTKSH